MVVPAVYKIFVKNLRFLKETEKIVLVWQSNKSFIHIICYCCSSLWRLIQSDQCCTAHTITARVGCATMGRSHCILHLPNASFLAPKSKNHCARYMGFPWTLSYSTRLGPQFGHVIFMCGSVIMSDPLLLARSVLEIRLSLFKLNCYTIN